MTDGSRAYFDDVSTEWDGMRANFFSDAIRTVALDALGVAPGQTAADLGAGTGFVTEELTARGLRVIAVDQSAAMLSVLTEKLGSGALECRVGTAEKLPVADASVDYVIANMYLHHVDEPASAIREAVRILKPGGGLAITDLDQHSHDFLRIEHRDRWLGFAHEDVRRWLRDASLADIEIGSIGSTCQADSSDGAAHASIGIFLATGHKPADRTRT